MNTRPYLPLLLTLSASLLLISCADTGVSHNKGTTIETLSTLAPVNKEFTKTDVKVGNGTEAATGKTVSVHYTGWLYDEQAAKKQGKKFDSSRDRGKPFQFPLGAGRVIKGWDQGVAGMKVGGQRTLIIPPNMGYGSRGAGSSIPPNATLLFDVELLGVE